MTDAVTSAATSGMTPATTLEPIHFWFDFISPFGYFASLRIDELAARHGRRVEWHPLLIGVTVMKVMGLKPLLETPLKKDYVLRQAARYTRRHGVSLGRSVSAPPMNPLPAARLLAWLRVHGSSPASADASANSSADASADASEHADSDAGSRGGAQGIALLNTPAHRFARTAYHAYWAEGRDLDKPAALRAVAAQAGLPNALVEAGLADPAAATLLRAEVDAAITRGVFGSPFVIVDDEPFFGVDSFELLDEWLARGTW